MTDNRHENKISHHANTAGISKTSPLYTSLTEQSIYKVVRKTKPVTQRIQGL